MKLREIVPTFNHFVALSTIYQSGVVGAGNDRLSANAEVYDVEFDSSILDEYIEDGIIEIKNEKFVMTDNGKNILNEVMF